MINWTARINIACAKFIGRWYISWDTTLAHTSILVVSKALRFYFCANLIKNIIPWNTSFANTIRIWIILTMKHKLNTSIILSIRPISKVTFWTNFTLTIKSKLCAISNYVSRAICAYLILIVKIQIITWICNAILAKNTNIIVQSKVWITTWNYLIWRYTLCCGTD